MPRGGLVRTASVVQADDLVAGAQVRADLGGVGLGRVVEGAEHQHADRPRLLGGDGDAVGEARPRQARLAPEPHQGVDPPLDLAQPVGAQVRHAAVGDERPGADAPLDMPRRPAATHRRC